MDSLLVLEPKTLTLIFTLCSSTMAVLSTRTCVVFSSVEVPLTSFFFPMVLLLVAGC